jgi:hypothetical protein
MCISRLVKSGIFASVLLIFQAGNAQCAMCRAAIETEGNSTKAEALNDGIVYLMIAPYLLVGVIGYIIYRMRKSKQV